MTAEVHARLLRRISLLITVCLISHPVHAKYSGGSGEADDPYQIATGADLLAIGATPADYDKHFILTADINLAPEVPGGPVFTQALIAASSGGDNRFVGVAFTGCFDGDNHVIANLSSQKAQACYLGVFGSVGQGGRVRNLSVEGVTIQGADRLGGIAGHNAGTLTNCHVSGEVRGDWYVGGLVGRNEGTLDDCHAQARVGGNAFLGTYGGLVGYNDGGTVTNCTAAGEVSGHGKNGGLIGENYYGLVINCHASAEVAGEMSVGGLIGANSGTVARCFATGRVSGGDFSQSVGGLVGGQGYGTLVDCDASGTVTGAQSVGGLAGSNSHGRILDCSATGAVVGAGYWSHAVGGLVGNDYASTVTHCWASGSVSVVNQGNAMGGLVGSSLNGVVRQSFWDVQGSGQSQSAGGTGLTREQMRDPQTFLTAGWDLVGERVNGTADLWLVSGETGRPVLVLVSDGYVPHTLDGSGTPADPYQIATAEDIGAICHHDWAAHYALTADIDLSGIVWSGSPLWAFGGTLQGGGHRISNLTIGGDACLGLFGRLYEGALVRDLGVEQVQVLGDDNCDALGTLAGISAGKILACYATGSVAGRSGSTGLGGLVGSSYGRVADCYAAVDVRVDGEGQEVGGFAGRASASTITRCYSVGRVEAGAGSQTLGGLVGEDWESAIRSCFWDIEASGMAGSAAGMGVTTAEMKNADIYSRNGWAGEPNWVLDSGKDYPRLAWQGTPGQIIAPPAPDGLTGAGTAEDPHRIVTPAQLERLARESILWDKAFVLLADLDLTGVALPCIGISSGSAFTGHFDGGGHVIANLNRNSGAASVSNQGLFGVIGPAGQVRSLRLVQATSTCGGGSNDLGILAGSNRGTIVQCSASGQILAAESCNWLGGLVGRNEGTIRECHAAVSIEAGDDSWRLGGLVGANYMHLADCYAEGDIVAGKDGRHLGGLVGYNEHISGGRATAEGWEDYTWEGAITHCYAIGRVSGRDGSEYVGGLVGGDWEGVVTSSYFLALSGGAEVVGLPLTDEQMKRQASFSDWDFRNTWTIQEGTTYPRLRWEESQQP
jgi:hypothetical protein